MLLHLDAGWNIIPIAILDQFEQCVGIITASIPALAALVSRYALRCHVIFFFDFSFWWSYGISHFLYRHRRERKSMQITTATHSKSSGSVEPPKKGNRGRYGSADGNTREPFDFFAFAYDPDRYKGNEFGQTYACAYSGNQKRPVPPGHRDSFITVHTDSEELVHRHPIDAIAATTTVTVNVTQRWFLSLHFENFLFPFSVDLWLGIYLGILGCLNLGVAVQCEGVGLLCCINVIAGIWSTLAEHLYWVLGGFL